MCKMAPACHVLPLRQTIPCSSKFHNSFYLFNVFLTSFGELVSVCGASFKLRNLTQLDESSDFLMDWDMEMTINFAGLIIFFISWLN